MDMPWRTLKEKHSRGMHCDVSRIEEARNAISPIDKKLTKVERGIGAGKI
jgi:hypothetical protein